jgi:hypothetical protein
VVAGNKHEGPILWGLLDGFVEAAGRGVMKRLILDRGFTDGEQIARCGGRPSPSESQFAARKR